MRTRPVLMAACLFAFAVSGVAGNAAGVTLSHGRQVQLNSGLQIQALAHRGDPTSSNVALTATQISLWKNLNFTAFNFGILQAQPCWQNAGRVGLEPPLRRWNCDQVLVGHRDAVHQQLRELPVSDEQKDIAGRSDPTGLSDMAATYADWKRQYPTALAFTNFSASSTRPPN